MNNAQKEAAKQAAVMLAFSEGKEILVSHIDSISWEKSTFPLWCWSEYEYKVVPEIVKVQLYKSPNHSQISALIVDKFDPNSGWVPCSDVIEIEVKDET